MIDILYKLGQVFMIKSFLLMDSFPVSEGAVRSLRFAIRFRFVTVSGASGATDYGKIHHAING